LTYNFDFWQIEEMAPSLVHSFEHQRVVMSPPVNIVYDPNDPNSVAAAAGQSEWAASYAGFEDEIDDDFSTYEPFSVILYPMYNSIESVRLDVTRPQPLVAVLTFSIYWRQLLLDILPKDLALESSGDDNNDALLVIFQGSCTPSFMYRINGPKASFLGISYEGHDHDGHYRDSSRTAMHQYATLWDLANSYNGYNNGDSSYTGIPLSGEYCPMSIHIYPFKEHHETTANPAIYTTIAALIFVFTSAVFVAYDFTVAALARRLRAQASASGAIVKNLFPENIITQLYENQQAATNGLSKPEAMSQRDNNTSGMFAPTPLSTKPGEDRPLMLPNLMESPTTAPRPKPMADLFPNTTVLFANLAGFTAWSSRRTPTEVFELLEALFARMDKLAAKRKVFKVETIGDCWVGATGMFTFF
jgi:hypothetical protein